MENCRLWECYPSLEATVEANALLAPLQILPVTSVVAEAPADNV